MKKSICNLSDQASELLKDPTVYKKLSEITKAIGVTPEEYLARFDMLLAKNPQVILNVFEKAYFKF